MHELVPESFLPQPAQRRKVVDSSAHALQLALRGIRVPTHAARHPTIGYNLPNFPELLEVSAAVASEYLARIVAHDVLHSTLPTIGMRNEAFHDLAILHAGGAMRDRCAATNPWEQFVLDECTDVACRININDRLVELLKSKKLTAMQTWYVKSFLQKVLTYQTSSYVCRLFGILPEAGDEEVRSIIAMRMASERKQGFPSWNTACDDRAP